MEDLHFPSVLGCSYAIHTLGGVSDIPIVPIYIFLKRPKKKKKEDACGSLFLSIMNPLSDNTE